MKMLKYLKPEKCTDDQDKSQFHKHVHVKRNAEGLGYAYATCGRSLVKVPVTLEESDTDGTVPLQAFAVSRKLYAKKEYVEMQLQELAVVDTAELVARYTRFNPLKTPDFDKIFPASKEKATRIALDVRLLKKVADAMGESVVILEIRDSNTAILVLPNSGNDCKGLVMPVDMDRAARKKMEPGLV